MSSKMLSSDQLAANRANAQLSTGPRTEAGKAKSARNAVRTGLTGRSILLSNTEADAYELHVARFACEYNPVGDREAELVQSLADTQWRLNRIPVLEAGIYAVGRINFADFFADQEPALQALLIENHTHFTYRRDLMNLSIQESRLRRNLVKDTAELAALQAKRQEAEKPAITAASNTQTPAVQPNGFVFSTAAAASAEPAHPAHEPLINQQNPTLLA